MNVRRISAFVLLIMNADTWQKLKTLFHAALDLGPADRAAFLATECDGDADVRSQVEELLSAHDDAGTFLNSPALERSSVVVSEESEDLSNSS